jgi:acetylornithine/N-succinyldiaminopimelate aminotransferase
MTISPILPVYRRSNITMMRGDGCYLFDDAGKKYLDFATGIAVNALGHGHPHIVSALKSQADALWHCSNMYMHPNLDRMAKRLVEATFADSVFFCSSGTEAVEAAIKFARRYHFTHANPHKTRLITFEGGFHGRSFAGISAGGNTKAREGYAPLLEGFDRAVFNDLTSVKNQITHDTAGIFLEPIQGEGGIVVASDVWLKELRTLCDEHGLLLICDEVQCGMGRSGTLLAFEHAGITPDITTIAKGIGNGFPLAATLVAERVGECMTPSSHGSTYGANPLAMAVGNAVLDVMLTPEFLPHVVQMGNLLKAKLEELVAAFPNIIGEVRGRGLMLGIAIQNSSAVDHYALAELLRTHGLLTAPAVEGRVIRILPPLIIDKDHINEAVSLLSKTLGEIK